MPLKPVQSPLIPQQGTFPHTRFFQSFHRWVWIFSESSLFWFNSRALSHGKLREVTAARGFSIYISSSSALQFVTVWGIDYTAVQERERTGWVHCFDLKNAEGPWKMGLCEWWLSVRTGSRFSPSKSLILHRVLVYPFSTYLLVSYYGNHTKCQRYDK